MQHKSADVSSTRSRGSWSTTNVSARIASMEHFAARGKQEP
jgi:hypothetical protein